MNDFTLLINNKIFISLILSWFLSQILKLILEFKKNGFSYSIFFRSGGMPSAHSASVSALCASVYISEGITTLFIISLAFAVLVMYDARGIRYEASKHAKLLNKLINKKTLDFPKLKELIGHEISEVVVGAILGILISVLVFYT